MTERPVLRVLPGRHKRAKAGHPWVFNNEIELDTATRHIAPGSLVQVVNAGGEPLGCGFFNPKSLAAVRLLDRDPEAVIDRDWFAARLGAARTLRDRMHDEPWYRLVHAEADGLPGLVVDRFGEVVVVQVNTAGMETHREALLEALDAVVAPRTLVLRADSAVRALEGLPVADRGELVKGTLDGPMAVRENGATFFAEPLTGQKTGWFFDQRENRAFVANLARGGSVLDVYTYGGGFGVLAARAGAREVTLIDRSEPALGLAKWAAEANQVVDRCHFVRGDAFGEMERIQKDRRRFDTVILDPPAFAKSKKDLAAGRRGYRKMTRQGAVLVAPGGILFVASCSHNISLEMLEQEVRRGLVDAHRTARILRIAGAAPDHPLHPYLPESAYLKALVLHLD